MSAQTRQAIYNASLLEAANGGELRPLGNECGRSGLPTERLSQLYGWLLEKYPTAFELGEEYCWEQYSKSPAYN